MVMYRSEYCLIFVLFCFCFCYWKFVSIIHLFIHFITFCTISFHSIMVGVREGDSLRQESHSYGRGKCRIENSTDFPLAWEQGQWHIKQWNTQQKVWRNLCEFYFAKWRYTHRFCLESHNRFIFLKGRGRKVTSLVAFGTFNVFFFLYLLLSKQLAAFYHKWKRLFYEESA